MFGKPTKWNLLLKAFPLWRPLTDFWRKTTKWPVLGKYSRWILNENHYDVTFIPINKELEDECSTVIPRQVVSEIIKESCHRVIMKVCLCRVGCGCQDHPMELGCIFMGEASRDIDPSMGRHVSIEEAVDHMNKCIESGLIPQIGRVDPDPFMLGIKPEDWGRFLTLCFCCTCCCIAMRYWQLWSPSVRERMHSLEGLSIKVTEDCNGCGKCAKSCFTSSIIIEDKYARIDLDCKGCGICAEVCPNNAIEISVSDGNKLLRETFKRIESYVDFVSEDSTVAP